ncbi:MAG: PKD domain-containing protein [Bacteroidetes bacterium]|nr:MAG: PKD domain-containing protein [Bacteroidota bacterium]
MKRIITTLFVLSVLATGAYAQHGQGDHLHCGTDQAMQKVFAEHPGIKAEFEAREAVLAEQDRIAFQQGYPKTRNTSQNLPSVFSTTPPQYIIPMVFHIVHDYGSENISDAQVIDAVRVLNEDFRKLNADTASIVSTFQGIADDAEIEFRLANIDPNGNCTNGIDRIASPETYIGDDGSKLNYWPRAKYLNVWVVKTISSGAAGYAYLPGTAPSASTDGILILSNYVGTIGTGNTTTGRALTHEVGHFLNLLHIWGTSNTPGVTCGSDNVGDTPQTKGWTSCNLTTNDVCNSGVEENVQNYMDYSYCYRMYTVGQGSRMRTALQNGFGQRNQLSTSSNHTATGILNNPPNVCAPQADFSPAETIYLCAGSSYTFNDLSWNGTPTAWNWTFGGGTPATSTSQNPTVQFNTPGTYNVSLTSSNASGSNTVTRNGIVVVLSATAQYNLWQYVESVENSSTFSADWTINNASGGQAFQRVTTTAYTGSASVRIQNYSTTTDDLVDEMISPSIDLTQIPSPVFTFRVAYRQKATGNTDKLRVLVSDNCGQTWVQRWAKSGTTLATVSGTQSTAFTPGVFTTEWRLETVNISTFTADTNFRIKFEFTSGGGNNLYIDDINIVSPNSISDPSTMLENFIVFPNPAKDNAMISMTLNSGQDVQLKVYDMIGREMSTLSKGNLPAGTHDFNLATSGFAKGVYLVHLNVGGKTLTQKLIVE